MNQIEIYKHYKLMLDAERHILTGSYVLKLHGLIERDVKDLDIILVNPTEHTTEKLKQLQEETNKGFRGGYEGQMFQIKHEKTNIDFFIVKSITEESMKLEDGVEISLIKPILDVKKRYNRDKDVLDLMAISRRIYGMVDFNNFLSNRK